MIQRCQLGLLFWAVLGAMLLCCQGRKDRMLQIPVLSIFSMIHTSSVPRILHQSWKDEKVPKAFQTWQKSWKDLHPHWQYNLWTDEMNRKLVEDHFEWFLPVYDTFPLEIFRADAARIMYMYKYGGVYADLDFRALKPMDDLLAGSEPEAFVGRLSDDMDWNQNIPNAWLASSPGHPFWMYCLLEITRASALVNCSGAECTGDYIVERTTGPWMLWRSVRRYARYSQRNSPTLTVLQPEIIYPLNWRPGQFDTRCLELKVESECYKLFPESFAITYWSHGWGTDET